MLVQSARLLQSAGAEVLTIPCNTAHCWLSEIRAAISIPVLDMIEMTSDALARDYGGRVGVMATAGTLFTGLYGRALEAKGLASIAPDDESQELLDRAIELVKAGQVSTAASSIQTVALRLAELGADVLVLGCTELPMALGEVDVPLPLVSPMEVLARGAVEAARGDRLNHAGVEHALGL